jgi:hypothetical protein
MQRESSGFSLERHCSNNSGKKAQWMYRQTYAPSSKVVWSSWDEWTYTLTEQATDSQRRIHCPFKTTQT